MIEGWPARPSPSKLSRLTVSHSVLVTWLIPNVISSSVKERTRSHCTDDPAHLILPQSIALNRSRPVSAPLEANTHILSGYAEPSPPLGSRTSMLVISRLTQYSRSSSGSMENCARTDFGIVTRPRVSNWRHWYLCCGLSISISRLRSALELSICSFFRLCGIYFFRQPF